MKKMIFTALILGLALMTYAQRGMRPDGEQRHERMKAMRVAYITEQLELTADEATRFWPVYNQIQAQREELRDEDIIPENMDKLSEKEAEALIAKVLDRRQKSLELDKKMVNDLSKVISQEKIARLFASEHQFRQRMASRIKERMEESDGRGKGRGNDKRPSRRQ
jgi:hypothetical protein